MPDFIDNKLIITCKDNNLKTKIERVIFTKNDKGELVFTMKKLLPMPKGFEDHDYSDYGYYWCNAVWGTKWDVMYPKIIQSGESYIFVYRTAWDPNGKWLETLCSYIKAISYPYKVKGEISVTHFFCEEYEEMGTELKWKPGQGFKIKENVKFEPIIKKPQSS